MIYTVGHSTRRLEEFLRLLSAHGVEQVVDVRRYPASRRHPHFARQALAGALAAAGIAYRHEPDLGGRRAPRRDSANAGWKNAGFRGYADHMGTAAFRAALVRLIELAEGRPTAILCAEALPSRCHRQLIADALTARGVEVRHILGAENLQLHRLSPHAQVLPDGGLRYPAGAPALAPSPEWGPQPLAPSPE
ncbi:MAG TPA: DUF488 domain-containing protein [Gemmatimonadales bacterium]